MTRKINNKKNNSNSAIQGGGCFRQSAHCQNDDEDDGDDKQEEYDELLENTTWNSLSANVQSEALFTKLGLRHLGRLQYSSRTKYYGYGVIVISILIGLSFLYAAFISKSLPDSGIHVLDGIKHDHYFCYLLPLTILPTILARYINWLARQHFEQN